MRHRVGLHETDAAGVMFAGHIATLAHAAYERALLAAGCDLAAVIRAGTLALPLRRSEADFLAPIRHGDTLALHVALGERRAHGYRVAIELRRDQDATPAARVVQTHVCIDADGRKHPLPETVAAALDRLADPRRPPTGRSVPY